MKIRPHLALLTLAALFLNASPLCAQEQQAEKTEDTATIAEVAPSIEIPISYKYTPEYCDFVAGFPEEPTIHHACEKEDDPNSCYDLVSYTKVLNVSTTVQVKIICNPATIETYEYFTPKVMENTVRAMTEGTVLKTFKVTNTDKDDYRLTGLVGQGQMGLYETLYIAQLWVAKSSIMSVEAQISGEQSKESDALFAGILNNIGYKDVLFPELVKDKENTAPEAKPATEEK